MWLMCEYTRNTFLSNSWVLSNATFSFLITWRSSSSKSGAMYKISWKSDDFTEIWWYIDFQNGGCPPLWNCFTTIRYHQFHVNLIHRTEDTDVWIFHLFGLKCLFRPPKWEFGGLWIINHRDPQKAHSCVNPRVLSYQHYCKNLLRGLTWRWVES